MHRNVGTVKNRHHMENNNNHETTLNRIRQLTAKPEKSTSHKNDIDNEKLRTKGEK